MKTFYVLLAAAAYVAAAAGNRRVIIKLKSHDPAVTSFVTAHVAAQQASSLDSLGPADAVHEQFNTTHFAGLAGSFSDDFLQRLNTTHADTIDYVEEDHAVQAYVQQARAPWGLARLSATGGQVYAFPPSAGAGVDVYVLDSGVQVDHPDLEGRATMVANYVPGEDNRDYTGHGTHIAGTIASKTFGVAKKARVLGIKVLDKSGMGYDSRIISGITYAINHRRAGVKTVINMSLGGKKSRALDEAVAAAVKAGVVVVVAAGNEHMDACQLSPSGARDAFAVGAADQRNRIAHFSNYGPCVQMYAPGVQIASTSNERGQTVRYMTGTSMASPHAAGIAALLMADQEFSSARDVMRAMTRIAKPFAKENDGHALLMASVPTGGQVRQDQANTSMDTPAETTPSHRAPVQQRPSPSQDDTARPQPAPVHRAPSTDTAPSHSVPVQRPSPSQDDLARQPTPTHRAPVQKRPSPSQDDMPDIPSDKPLILPNPDGKGSGWMIKKPGHGHTHDSKKPCTGANGPTGDAPSDSTTTLDAPALDNSTLTNVTAPVDNSTLTNITAPLDNSTLTNVTAPVDNSTLTNVTTPSDNSMLTNVTAPVDNSTLTNVTAPVDNSTLTNITAPLDNSTLTDTTPLEGTCRDGAFRCRGKGFVKCDHGGWVGFQCAPGTECQQTTSDVILCDYPKKKDCPSTPKNDTIPAPLPSNNTTTNVGNATTPILPGFEIPSNKTKNDTVTVTVPAPNVPDTPEVSITQPIVENAQPILSEPSNDAPKQALAKNPWD